MSVSAGSARAVDPHAGPGLAPPRTAVATVCLSGSLEDKLAAAAAAGFDGVEIFEPDFVASPSSAAEVRRRCADLGLTIDLYQPFRDFDSVDPQRLAANLRRAEHKFAVMEALGTDLILVCSSVSPDAVDDDGRIAEQLHTLAERAAARGMRVSYEALAWGRHVNTYDRSWEIVRRADHPALGLCVDSFHILSRGSDPAGIRDIPGEKLFFLQLADAPHMDMNVLQWSRHHRLFPGQGAFDLPAFLGHVLAAGYGGPLSLEVFNDVFRQADPRRAAVDALRSLLALAEAVRDPAQGHLPAGVEVGGRSLPPTPGLHGFAFAEVAVDDECEPAIARTLTALGFRHAGTHRSKPVQLWSHGQARVLLNAEPTAHGAAVAALGVEVDDPQAAAERATRLLAPVLPRTRGPAEADLSAVPAPDGTSVFFCRTGAEDGWLTDFPGDERDAGSVTDRSQSSTTSRSRSPSTTSTRRRCSTAACWVCRRSTPRRSPPRSVSCATGRSPTPTHAAARAERVRAAPRRVGARRRGAPARRLRLHGRARLRPRGPCGRCAAAAHPGQLLRRPRRPARPAARAARDHARAGRAARPRRARRVPALLHRGAGRAGVLRGRAAGGGLRGLRRGQRPDPDGRAPPLRLR